MFSFIKKRLRLSRTFKILLLVIIVVVGASLGVIIGYAVQRQQVMNSQSSEEVRKSLKPPLKEIVKEKQPVEQKVQEDVATNQAVGGDYSADSSPALDPRIDTSTIPPPQLHLPTAALQMSHSTVVLPNDGFSAHIDVWAEGADLTEPQVTAPTGVGFFVESSVGKRWIIRLTQQDLNSSGQGVVKISSQRYDPFKMYHGEIVVTWHAKSP